MSMPELLEWVRVQPVEVGLLLILLAAASEYVCPPLPADAVVLSGALLVVSGATRFENVYAASVLGGVLGATLQYALGRTLARSGRLDAPWVGRVFGAEGLSRFRTAMARHGVWVLLLNRVLPGVRAVTFLAAGAAEVPPWTALWAGGLSHLVWTAGLLALGVWVGESAEKILAVFYVQQRNLFAVVVGAVLLFAAVKVWQRLRRA